MHLLKVVDSAHDSLFTEVKIGEGGRINDRVFPGSSFQQEGARKTI